jgi:diguanylate cyclase (GGDEF)-like protein/PAS domain S-box-containing protein
MALFAAAQRPLPGHPAPPYSRPVALALAALPLALGTAQLATRLRSSAAFAYAALGVDVLAVFGTLAVFSFDPRHSVFALVVVLDAQAGLTLGLTRGLAAWVVVAGGDTLMVSLAAARLETPVDASGVVLRAGVGLLLAFAGGFLAEELAGERDDTGAAERERELSRLQDAEARYRSLVEGTPVVTYIDAVDRHSSTIYMSPQVLGLVGYGPDEWIARPDLWERLLHPDDRARVMAEHARTNATGEPFRMEYRIVPRDGGVVWVRDEAILVRDARGRPRFWQGVMVDITERKRTEEQVAFLAYHDTLTGLPNRAMFEEALELALARARRAGRGVAVLFVDLDNFKVVNDTFGHSAGDQLLRELSGRLREAVRDTDVVARQSGDEFLVLLADLELPSTSADGVAGPVELAEAVGRRIHESLERPFLLDGTPFTVSASIGLSIYPLTASDGRTLLKQADAAMYRRKRGADDRPVALALDPADLASGLPAARLMAAVRGQQWELHYQPIIDLTRGAVVGLEALLRWRQEDGRLVWPEDFIPLAEDMGLIGDIGDWVVREVCRQALAWRKRGISIPITINLSPRHLWRPEAVKAVVDLARSSGLGPEGLVVDITESAALADQDRTQRAVEELHRLGVRVALDDFGSGGFALSRLRGLPVDALKIDRTFVRNLPDDPEAAGMVEALIALARSLKAEPLAEGIETEEQRLFLVARGCSLGQGFHLGRPQPAEEIAARLEAEGGAVAVREAPSGEG